MKKTKVKKHTGRPPRHGGFSLMIRRGELPERRGYIRRYLTACREQLIRDLGPMEADLTAAEIIILDRCISKLAVIRMIEEYFAETGPGSWFVQGIQPSCKEDGLMVMLNATPGKSGYAVTYPTTDQIAMWPTAAACCSASSAWPRSCPPVPVTAGRPTSRSTATPWGGRPGSSSPGATR